VFVLSEQNIRRATVRRSKPSGVSSWVSPKWLTVCSTGAAKLARLSTEKLGTKLGMTNETEAAVHSVMVMLALCSK